MDQNQKQRTTIPKRCKEALARVLRRLALRAGHARACRPGLVQRVAASALVELGHAFWFSIRA